MKNKIMFLVVVMVSILLAQRVFTEESVQESPEVIKERDIETKGSKEEVDDELIACTMDAKICPDGSYVGRIPPDCRFRPCPDIKDSKNKKKKKKNIRDQ